MPVTRKNLKTAQFNMLQKQLREQFMLADTVLNAMEKIQREIFVPDAYKSFAYADMAIPLSHSETMMTPNEEARMLAALEIHSSDKILEIGTGSGYITALLATLGHSVTSVDIHRDFLSEAGNKFKQLHLYNITLDQHNGVNGYEAEQPYDIICVTGGLHFINQALLQQIKPKGKLFAMVGEHPCMQASIFSHTAQKKWQQSIIFETQIRYLQDIPLPAAFEF